MTHERTATAPRRGALGADAVAEVLTEALPYIRRFADKVVVVKYGGNALAGAAGEADGQAGAATGALASFAGDIVLMAAVGILPVVVHGGGPQIGDLMRRLGKTPEFRDGLRVTDAETLDIARMVLVGKINPEIVGAMNVHGPVAVGLSGEDAGLISASAAAGGLGYVGDVAAIDPTIVRQLLAQGLVPVVATIGSDALGQAYNINADTVAGALAGALGAEKLVMLTDVEGIRADASDPSSLLQRVEVAELEAMLASGAIDGGMIPKADACVAAIRSGVGAAHVLDGRVPHALLLELFTEEGVGTMVVAGDDGEGGGRG